MRALRRSFFGSSKGGSSSSSKRSWVCARFREGQVQALVLGEHPQGTCVVSVEPGSAAEAQGVPVGGLLIAIGGEQVFGMPPDEVQLLIETEPIPITIYFNKPELDEPSATSGEEKIEVTCRLRGEGSLGFTLVEHKYGTMIGKLQPGSQAVEACVPMGGLLVSVNDEPVTGLDVATVFTILSSCEPPLDLRFRVTASSPAAQKALAKMQQRSGGVHSRINPAFDDLTRAVQFTFGASAGPLGIHMVDHVNGGVVIDGVGQGSIAEREGVVVGSMILGVNSEDVRELNVAPVLAICMSAGRPITLHVLPPAGGAPPVGLPPSQAAHSSAPAASARPPAAGPSSTTEAAKFVIGQKVMVKRSDGGESVAYVIEEEPFNSMYKLALDEPNSAKQKLARAMDVRPFEEASAAVSEEEELRRVLEISKRPSQQRVSRDILGQLQRDDKVTTTAGAPTSSEDEELQRALSISRKEASAASRTATEREEDEALRRALDASLFDVSDAAPSSAVGAPPPAARAAPSGEDEDEALRRAMAESLAMAAASNAPPQAPSRKAKVTEVRVRCTEEGPLGLKLADHADGTVVQIVHAGSMAERLGVPVGALLLKVNSEDVRGLPYETVALLIQTAGRPLELLLQRLAISSDV